MSEEYEYIDGIVQGWDSGDSLGFGAHIIINSEPVRVTSRRVREGHLREMSCGRIVRLYVQEVHGELVLMKAPVYL